MTKMFIIGGVLGVSAFLWWAHGKCRMTLWMFVHDAGWHLLRDDKGRPTQGLEWHCHACGKMLGVTGANRSLKIASVLRRQIPWARERSRIEKSA